MLKVLLYSLLPIHSAFNIRWANAFYSPSA